MADTIDMAQERQTLMLEKQIAYARPVAAAPSAFCCRDGEAAIPTARRIAMDGQRYLVAQWGKMRTAFKDRRLQV